MERFTVGIRWIHLSDPDENSVSFIQIVVVLEFLQGGSDGQYGAALSPPR